MILFQYYRDQYYNFSNRLFDYIQQTTKKI